MIVTLLIWLGPTLALLLINVFLFGLVLNELTILTFLLIPVFGLILTRLLLLLHSRRTSGSKAWRFAVWTILLIVLWFFSLFMPRANHRVTHLNSKSKFEAAASAVFPEFFSGTLELGAPSSTELHKYSTAAAIFESKSYTLLCKYSETEYFAEKAALDDRWSFRTQPLETGASVNDRDGITIEPSTMLGNDVFHFLIPADGTNGIDNSIYFYKYCMLIVTNDVKHEIGYLVFEDPDLDEASDLQDFLIRYCGWNVIRKPRMVNIFPQRTLSFG